MGEQIGERGCGKTRADVSHRWGESSHAAMMDAPKLMHDRRRDLRDKINALCHQWQRLRSTGETSGIAFAGQRDAIIDEARRVLAQEGLDGPWERWLLDGAKYGPGDWHHLAMSRARLALRVSALRASGEMSIWHYEREAAKIPQ